MWIDRCTLGGVRLAEILLPSFPAKLAGAEVCQAAVFLMPLQLRTNMEKRNMRKFSTILLHLAATAAVAGVPAAAVFYGTSASALASMALGPSRRFVSSPRRACPALTAPCSPQLAVGHQPRAILEL